MRLARARIDPEFLQWFGLLGAALTWAAQLVIGYGVATARCSIAGSRWGIDLDTWEIALMAVAGALVLVSEAAAIAILLETRGTEHDDPPPWGRRHFFASTAAIGNILFLGAILLSGLATLYQSPCRQA